MLDAGGYAGTLVGLLSSSGGPAEGLKAGQLVGAVAVLPGGFVAAALLRRAQRADSEMVAV